MIPSRNEGEKGEQVRQRWEHGRRQRGNREGGRAGVSVSRQLLHDVVISLERRVVETPIRASVELSN